MRAAAVAAAAAAGCVLRRLMAAAAAVDDVDRSHREVCRLVFRDQDRGIVLSGLGEFVSGYGD